MRCSWSCGLARLYLSNLDAFYAGTRVNHIKTRKASIVKEERTQMAAKQIDGFLYMSPATEQMVEEVLNVAQYDCNVIIQGETGVGKEKVFDLLQQNSPRRSQPCIKINCATIQENLAESEFFGYEKGSFTGAAASGKEGYFEIANNGTLFLDEIGSLPLAMQSKLLRVLQENSFYALCRRNQSGRVQRACDLRKQYSAAKAGQRRQVPRTCIIV